MKRIEFDLANDAVCDLDEFNFSGIEQAIVYIPMSSVGRTNSYIDICSDYVDASWAAEMLAATAGSVDLEEEYIRSSHTTRFKLTLNSPSMAFSEKLRDALLIYGEDCDREGEEGARYLVLRDSIEDYEEALPEYSAILPDLIDSYYVNLVSGAYSEMRSEAPDWYEDQIRKYPERELGFHKSAYSGRLSGNCYSSPSSWLVPNEVPLDVFFAKTGQNYRIEDFVTAEVLVLSGKSFVLSEDLIAYFPMNHYFKSRACASFSARDDENAWDQFGWRDASFTHSAYETEFTMVREPHRESCLVHTGGTMIIVNDGHHNHLLYDTKPLNTVQTKLLSERLGDVLGTVAAATGLSERHLFDWSTLSDEQFEQLCYDVVYSHPKFDSSTIRKLGSSRSRDGGRDIEVWEAPGKNPGTPRRKWVFQCKLTQSKSLGATKVTDIGDMLEQYDAEGFGVMTSTLIDATLYSKIDSICARRSIESLNFSVLELSRELTRKPAIRRRYFPDE
ncbi:hypothetical protein [Rhizobium sp. AU243]|uniref:hypothetical protein n=1 Tax=Rhizobium sp. AU243 TaxID=2303425 RepID=UPI0010CC43CC|nr:hypothetical protein [Rhizobium sp. AU243]TKV76133.1 hypothetical protein D0C28_10755 [Rhizobium sp. AU243]